MTTIAWDSEPVNVASVSVSVLTLTQLPRASARLRVRSTLSLVRVSPSSKCVHSLFCGMLRVSSSCGKLTLRCWFFRLLLRIECTLMALALWVLVWWYELSRYLKRWYAKIFMGYWEGICDGVAIWIVSLWTYELENGVDCDMPWRNQARQGE